MLYMTPVLYFVKRDHIIELKKYCEANYKQLVDDEVYNKTRAIYIRQYI